jgi:hypothetical protein
MSEVDEVNLVALISQDGVYRTLPSRGRARSRLDGLRPNPVERLLVRRLKGDNGLQARTELAPEMLLIGDSYRKLVVEIVRRLLRYMLQLFDTFAERMTRFNLIIHTTGNRFKFAFHAIKSGIEEVEARINGIKLFRNTFEFAGTKVRKSIYKGLNAFEAVCKFGIHASYCTTSERLGNFRNFVSAFLSQSL